MFMDKEGYDGYLSGVTDTKRLGGVGIAVTKRWSIQSVYPFTPRIMFITALTPSTPVTVISFYAPAEPKSPGNPTGDVDDPTVHFTRISRQQLWLFQHDFADTYSYLGTLARKSPPLLTIPQTRHTQLEENTFLARYRVMGQHSSTSV